MFTKTKKLLGRISGLEAENVILTKMVLELKNENWHIKQQIEYKDVYK